jgi:hypothetical protein
VAWTIRATSLALHSISRRLRDCAVVSVARFLVGIALALVAFGPLVAGMGAVRRRLLGDRGIDAVLVDTVLVLTAIVVVAELLGSFGWFRLVPFVLSCAVLGSAAWVACAGSAGPSAPPGKDPAPKLTWDLEHGLAAATLVVVAATWMTGTIEALREGMISHDTIWYHLPAAARFERLADRCAPSGR